MNTKSSAEFQMDFLNRLSFNRFGGTDDEKRAAELILSEIEALGGKGELFEFSIPGYSISKASFTVLEPYEEEITEEICDDLIRRYEVIFFNEEKNNLLKGRYNVKKLATVLETFYNNNME
jgi:hypothetical protein